MFVTASDFDGGEFNIPTSQDAPNSLEDFIPTRERDILRKMLGSALYEEFIQAVFVDITASPLVAKPDEEIPQKWKNLRDGANYEYRSEAYRYNGLSDLLKPFIVSEWITFNSQKLSSLGVSEPSIENSKVVSPARLISMYWSSFLKQVGRFDRMNDTFYGFMFSCYKTDFPDWKFTFPGFKNQFGL